MGQDILIIDAAHLSDAGLNEVLTKAVELNVPVLIRKYSARFGPMGRKKLTSDILAYLIYQNENGRPAATCQVQGAEEKKFEYSFLIDYFKSPPNLREEILNMLDNPVESDSNLTAAFESPEAIQTRDVTGFGIECPIDSHCLRAGVKIPSYRRWLLVGSQYSVSGFHRDAKGFWTAVELQTGSKDWFWAEPNEENVDHLREHYQYNSISKFTKVYHIHLDPGDLFIMNPGIIHAVVTTRDSIAAGSHFLLPETLDRSIRLAKEDIGHHHLTNDPSGDGRKLYFQLLKVRPGFVSSRSRTDQTDNPSLGHSKDEYCANQWCKSFALGM